MEKFINGVNKVMSWIGGIGLISLMLLISVGVITRYIFGFSIPTSYEMVEQYLMPITVFIVLGYSYKSGIFPRVDSFVMKLRSEKLKFLINISIILLEILVFIFVTYLLLDYSIYAFQTGMGFESNGISFPMYPIHLLVFIGFAWMTIIMIYEFIKGIKNKEIDVLEETEEKNVI